jgi:hypothetical protein
VSTTLSTCPIKCSGTKFYGTLEQAQAKCDADATCGWLHDFNCDGRYWRFCSNDATDANMPVGDGKACAMKKDEYFTVCGRSDAGCSKVPIAADVESKHEVRCCSDKAHKNYEKNAKCKFSIWGESDIPTCIHAATFFEASNHCARDGARLCTKEELASDCTALSGCGHDADMVWPSSIVPASTNAPTPTPTPVPTPAPTFRSEELKVELAVDMNKAQFNAAAQAALKAKIAAQLGVAAVDVELRVLAEGEESRRRLAAAALRVVAIIKVPVNKIVVALKAVEAPKFASATGAKVTEITPAASAEICASCEYAKGRISVTHYKTTTKTGHRCYRHNGGCDCVCN